ncbi:MAG: UDP-N-acetylmuramate dehydrogenase [Bacteroidetes bacterium]|nr:MAG: UDP-N-acetylmuramate dehydrogenase [Bacteroidota bacterium]
MNLIENRSLKDCNTFGIEVNARYFAEITREEEVVPLLSSLKPDQRPLLILGDGSNILFTDDFPGTVIRINTKGIAVLNDDSEAVILRVSAGEEWDEVVEYCVEQGWGGIENLSLIPGRMGAAPIQNIGAYGVELKEVLLELEAIHLETGEPRTFKREECRFGYRESIFKTTLRGHYLILHVTLKLSKKPQLNLEYGSIRKELDQAGNSSPTLHDVREVVCRIRRSKLPDPSVNGNAGSFFRNPVIRSDQFELLKKQYPSVISYPDPNGVKLAAAWLIEQCNWKGKRTGDAGVHPDQPLVLVNYGNATGQEILDLAALIRQSVLSRFGILLEPEVNIF